MDIHCFAFNNLFNPAFLGEPFVAVGVGLDHFDELMRSDEVVEDDDIFGIVGDGFFRIVE